MWVILLVQLAEAEIALDVKTKSLSKASARNKEVTFMLAWLERQYAQLDNRYQHATSEVREAKDALGRESTANARATLKARKT
jgi:hypothetical protein